MKPLLLAHLAVLMTTLLLASCGKPKEIDYMKLDMVNDLLIDPDTKKPFTGIARIYHPDGKLMREFPIKNGVFHGTVKEWHANGNPSAQTDFVHGKRSGRNMEWHQSGAPFQERIYQQDHIVSEKRFETGK